MSLVKRFALLSLALGPMLGQQPEPQAAPLAATPAPAPAAVHRVAPSHVNPLNTYHRVICVVPIVGKGTRDDPRRPQYAPFSFQNGHAAPLATRTGIIAFTQLPSDDGNMALVEFVAADRSALLPILNDKKVVSFEKSKHKQAEIETELRKYRKTFTLDRFGVPTL